MLYVENNKQHDKFMREVYPASVFVVYEKNVLPQIHKKEKHVFDKPSSNTRLNSNMSSKWLRQLSLCKKRVNIGSNPIIFNYESC